MRNRRAGVLSALALAAFAAVPVSAHHSVAGEFDTSKTVTLKGAISKVEWINPHAYFHVDVKDVDSFFERALAAGATVLQPIKNEPYGRICKLQDPFGHQWFFNTLPNQRH